MLLGKLSVLPVWLPVGCLPCLLLCWMPPYGLLGIVCAIPPAAVGVAAPFGLGGTGAWVAANTCCCCPTLTAEPDFSLLIIRKEKDCE